MKDEAERCNINLDDTAKVILLYEGLLLLLYMQTYCSHSPVI